MIKHQKSFTLIEILVVIVIFAFIIGGLFAILNVANISWHSSMGLVELQQSVRQAIDGMTREIRQLKRETGRDITVGSGSITFYIPEYSDPIRYRLENNQIIREYPAGTTKILANGITSLTFCCWVASCTSDCSTSGILQIVVQADKTVWGKTLSFALTEKVRLRNEN